MSSTSATTSSSTRMPFDYLDPPESTNNNSNGGSSGNVNGGRNEQHPAPQIQFQIPSAFLSGVPTLAPGGGAEVLQPGMWAANALGDADAGGWGGESAQMTAGEMWMVNNGFEPFPSAHRTSPSSMANLFAAQPPTPPTPLSPTQSVHSHSAESLSALFASQGVSQPNSAPVPGEMPSLYSTTGLDLATLFARVVTRPNPVVQLGPIDDRCSFCVVDVRRHDAPIIYCSRSFLSLTGYREDEVIGRNCRFLQGPPPTSSTTTSQRSLGKRRASESDAPVAEEPILPVTKGSTRTHTSHQTVALMRKAVIQEKEVQVKLVNYRRDGAPFLNLVSIIPLRELGPPDSVTGELETQFFVGFQVDVSHQTSEIGRYVQRGRYVGDVTRSLTSGAGLGAIGIGGVPPLSALTLGGFDRNAQLQVLQGSVLAAPGSGNKKAAPIPPQAVHPDLRALLGRKGFVRSFSSLVAYSSTNGADGGGGGEGDDGEGDVPDKSGDGKDTSGGGGGGGWHPPGSPTSPSNQAWALSMAVLEAGPDFVHVVSLKGTFLYVAPAVKRVLGWEASELEGKGLTDLCHPKDVIPLLRELKESSMGVEVSSENGGSQSTNQAQAQAQMLGLGLGLGMGLGAMGGGATSQPKTVDLLFRAKTKSQTYVWLECRGRLHVEPGKGRKAIVLSGRAREMGCVGWGGVLANVGMRVRKPLAAIENVVPGASIEKEGDGEEREVWGTLSDSGVVVNVSLARGAAQGTGKEEIRAMGGWTVDEVVGRRVKGFVVDERTDGNVGASTHQQIDNAILSVVGAMKASRARSCQPAESSSSSNGFRLQQPPKPSMAPRKVFVRVPPKDGGAGKGMEGWLVLYPVGSMVVRKRRASGSGPGEDEGDEENGEGEGEFEEAESVSERTKGAVCPPLMMFQMRVAPESKGVDERDRVEMSAMEVDPYFVPTTAPTRTGATGQGQAHRMMMSDVASGDPSLLVHTHIGAGEEEANVFGELDPGTESSWQYRIQQLRYANARMEDEVRGLEARLGITSGSSSATSGGVSLSMGPSGERREEDGQGEQDEMDEDDVGSEDGEGDGDGEDGRGRTPTLRAPVLTMRNAATTPTPTGEGSRPSSGAAGGGYVYPGYGYVDPTYNGSGGAGAGGSRPDTASGYQAQAQPVAMPVHGYSGYSQQQQQQQRLQVTIPSSHQQHQHSMPPPAQSGYGRYATTPTPTSASGAYHQAYYDYAQPQPTSATTTTRTPTSGTVPPIARNPYPPSYGGFEYQSPQREDGQGAGAGTKRGWDMVDGSGGAGGRR